MTLKERVAKLTEVSGKIKKVFEQAGDEFDMDKVTEVAGTAKEKIAALRKMKAEEDELGKAVDEEQELCRIKAENEEAEKKAIAAGRMPLPAKSEKGAKSEEPIDPHKYGGLGDIFVRGTKGRKLVECKELEVGVPEGVTFKTLMETSAGFASQAIRNGLVVPYAAETPKVIDIVPQGRSDQSSVAYMEQTTRTNNAAERAESAIFGEAAFAYTARSAECEDIGVWLPISDRQLEDVPAVQSILNQELPLMLRQRLDSQILNGSGTTPELEGILNHASLQTQAKSGNVCDTFYKGMTKVRKTGFGEPSAHVIHPGDWEDIRLLKDNNGNYIWGHPSEAGPERMWGKVVVVTTYITEGTGLTGDFAQFCMFFERSGVVMKITDSHDTYFIYGKQAMRAVMRGAMVWKRAAAFCSLTGL